MAWKPERKRLSDQVAEQLKWQILEGRYVPGDKLPSERVLAEELGVTRLTLREALKVTEAADFTATRHGSGTIVCDVWENATFQILAEILNAGQQLSPSHIRSLLEFRMVVFKGFAKVIATNARAEHVKKLQDIVEQERSSIDDMEALISLDHEFQKQLAAASGNLIYSLLIQSVKRAYLSLSRIVYEALDDFTPIVEVHAAITRAVEARDTELVQKELTFFVAAGNSIITKTLETDEETTSNS